MNTYIAITLDGRTLDNRGKGYASREGARHAALRKSTVAVETRRLSEPPPHINDAQGWNQYRLRAGIAG